MARGGSLLAVMHTEITDTGSSIEVAKRDWKGPLAAYPESGYFTMPNWQFVDVIAPEDFAAHAADASACWKIPPASRCPVRKERRVFLQGGAHIGMVGSERLLLDGERPLVQRLGAGQVPDRCAAAGEGVEALGQRR